MIATSSRNSSLWLGWVLSVLVVVILLADAAVGLLAPHLIQETMQATGFSPALATPLSLIMLGCAIIYAVPRTATLGAILITAFCGGAICTHFRLGELASPPQIICLLLAVMAWGGLYLRDPRLRAVLPLRITN